MFNRIFMVVSGVFFLIPGLAQDTGHYTTLKQRPVNRYHTMLFSVDYASNSNILGNVTPENRQPSFSPSVIYFHPTGADLSAIYSYIGNSDDSLTGFSSELDLMLGYTIQPFRNFTLYPGYSHFFHSQNSHDLKAMFTDDIRIDADYDYRFLNLGVSAGYYLGKKSTFYASARNFYRISINKFLSPKAYLMLQPGFDANFGNYEYLNLYYLDELRENEGFYFYLLYNYPALRQYVNSVRQEHPELSREEIIDDYLENEAEDNFKLTSLNLSLPVYYTIGKFGINLGVFVYIPIEQPDYLNKDVQFFFNVGLSYDITFNQ